MSVYNEVFVFKSLKNSYTDYTGSIAFNTTQASSSQRNHITLILYFLQNSGIFNERSVKTRRISPLNIVSIMEELEGVNCLKFLE